MVAERKAFTHLTHLTFASRSAALGPFVVEAKILARNALRPTVCHCGLGRIYSDARQPAQPAQGLGGPDKLARVLRYLRAADLRCGPQGRVDRRRSTGRSAGDARGGGEKDAG